MRISLLLACAAVAGGCTPSLRGTYADSLGAVEYTFGAGGSVSVAVMGMESTLRYEVRGNRVRILAPAGSQVLTLEKDGSLAGPLGLRLVKRN